ANVKETTPETILNYIHANKTGALIRGSVETGALLAGAKGSDLKHIEQYANCIGLVFQIVDDILDVTTSAKQLGKSNSDSENGKLTFVSLYGLEGSRKHAQLLIAKAQKALDKLKNVRKNNLWPLYQMAEFFKNRTY
ncbi:MAG: polyprenyl synthetase family protein, partial [Elusimicrobiaceae bacterium]|nr:polyprenyl synthetase family protein [Elusimicrobiaceae bacterium]